MTELKEKYQQWLATLANEVEQFTQHPITTLAQYHAVISDYVQAGADLTRYETQLFLETFKAQAQAEQQPELWPETLWMVLAKITDTTTIERQEFFADLAHQGVYQAGESVGMGRYCCADCGHEIDYFHPAVLAPCTNCQGANFSRNGMPL